MTTLKYLLNHQKDLQYLKEMNRLAKLKGLKHLIITHHLPIKLNIKKDKEDLYMTDLSNEIRNLDVLYWICGHVHHNFILQLEKTKIISNQRGKPGTFCNDYNPNFVIKI